MCARSFHIFGLVSIQWKVFLESYRGVRLEWELEGLNVWASCPLGNQQGLRKHFERETFKDAIFGKTAVDVGVFEMQIHWLHFISPMPCLLFHFFDMKLTKMCRKVVRIGYRVFRLNLELLQKIGPNFLFLRIIAILVSKVSTKYTHKICLSEYNKWPWAHKPETFMYYKKVS